MLQGYATVVAILCDVLLWKVHSLKSTEFHKINFFSCLWILLLFDNFFNNLFNNELKT